MSNKTTLGQITELQDSSWINDPFDVLFTVVKQETAKKTGKPFWRCKFTDPNDPSTPDVDVTFFTDPSRYNGAIVEVGGTGNKKKLYNGKTQIELGRQAVIKRISGGAATPSPAASRPPAATPLAVKPAATVRGDSVGNVLKIAAEFMLAGNIEPTEDNIVEVAGTILRAATRLEHGEHMQQAAQPVKRPQPGHNGQVATDDTPEDVPY